MARRRGGVRKQISRTGGVKVKDGKYEEKEEKGKRENRKAMGSGKEEGESKARKK